MKLLANAAFKGLFILCIGHQLFIHSLYQLSIQHLSVLLVLKNEGAYFTDEKTNIQKGEVMHSGCTMSQASKKLSVFMM